MGPTKVLIFRYKTQLVFQWQAARPLSNCYQLLDYDTKRRKRLFFVDELVRQVGNTLSNPYDGKFY